MEKGKKERERGSLWCTRYDTHNNVVESAPVHKTFVVAQPPLGGRTDERTNEGGSWLMIVDSSFVIVGGDDWR